MHFSTLSIWRMSHSKALTVQKRWPTTKWLFPIHFLKAVIYGVSFYSMQLTWSLLYLRQIFLDAVIKSSCFEFLEIFDDSEAYLILYRPMSLSDSQLNCPVNRLIGFYVRRLLVAKGLRPCHISVMELFSVKSSIVDVLIRHWCF